MIIKKTALIFNLMWCLMFLQNENLFKAMEKSEIFHKEIMKSFRKKVMKRMYDRIKGTDTTCDINEIINMYLKNLNVRSIRYKNFLNKLEEWKNQDNNRLFNQNTQLCIFPPIDRGFLICHIRQRELYGRISTNMWDINKVEIKNLFSDSIKDAKEIARLQRLDDEDEPTFIADMELIFHEHKQWKIALSECRLVKDGV